MSYIFTAYFAIGLAIGLKFWVKFVKEDINFKDSYDYVLASFMMIILPLAMGFIWPLIIVGFLIKLGFKK